ncbi:MAG: zf-HC2 domain-containing protein [[Eubacterium] siraeum]|nr:zf-HC2 domain-containing protein [[Eubacterium] siraeum]
MKISCDIIRDLLPLYNDGVCSKESAELIDEHLKDCADCADELVRLKEETPVRLLKSEESDIIGTFRRGTLKKGLFLLVCVVVFPAVSVLFTSLYTYFNAPVKIFLVTALAMLNTVYIPAVVKNNRTAVITVSSVITPILIFFMLNANNVVGLIRDYAYYSMGFTLLGIPCAAYFILSVGFVLLKLHEDYESPLRYKRAGLRLGVVESFILIVASILHPYYSMNETYDVQFRIFKMTVPWLFFMWVIILLIRFWKTNGFIKASVLTFATGLMISLYPALEYFTYYQDSNDKYCFWQANIFSGDSRYLIANVSLIILMIAVSVSVILFVIGKWGDKEIIGKWINKEITPEHGDKEITPEHGGKEITPEHGGKEITPENKEE